MKHKRTGTGCYLLIVLTIGAIVWAANSIYYARRSAALNARFPKTIAAHKPETTYDSKPYILGRMAVIDAKDHTVDDLWYELPEDRRANDDSEVETIVYITWSRSGDDAGNPGTGMWRAEVEVVDPSIPAIVGGSEHFNGGWKPGTGYRNRSTMRYPRPYSSIVYYLTSLPRTKQKEITFYDLDPKASKELDKLIKDLKEPPKRR